MRLLHALSTFPDHHIPWLHICSPLAPLHVSHSDSVHLSGALHLGVSARRPYRTRHVDHTEAVLAVAQLLVVGSFFFSLSSPLAPLLLDQALLTIECTHFHTVCPSGRHPLCSIPSTFTYGPTSVYTTSTLTPAVIHLLSLVPMLAHWWVIQTTYFPDLIASPIHVSIPCTGPPLSPLPHSSQISQAFHLFSSRSTTYILTYSHFWFFSVFRLDHMRILPFAVTHTLVLSDSAMIVSWLACHPHTLTSCQVSTHPFFSLTIAGSDH